MASSIPKSESFTIHELSQQSSLPEPTLRYYEKIGIIQPVPRDPSSGHRRYPADTVRMVKTLVCLRASDLPIEDMRTYLQLLEKRTQGAIQQKELSHTHSKNSNIKSSTYKLENSILREKLPIGMPWNGEILRQPRA
ncbi:MerR family transcriptional regulator [Dictyobacter alpinus]|uniref:MerR family transcriptional regulator n=1 Tax=Dictyobacter alpinus TaxID=2014873 RepID=UPI000F8354BF